MQKEYQCSKCGKTFKRKFNYENHIFSTGLPCDYKIAITTNGKELLKVTKNSGDEVIKKNTPPWKSENLYQEFLNFLQKKKINGKTLTICRFCGKDLVSDFEIKNHFEKKWCTHGNNFSEILDGSNNITINEEKKSKKNGSLKVYNTQIHNHINTQIFNTTNEITKNINIVNNNLNIIHSDKINAFGKENLDILTEDMLDEIIENPNGGLVRLIKYIHFNPDVPENRNVVIKNKKDPYVDVFNGDYWEKQDKDTTIHNLISTKKDIMDDHFENMIEKKLVNNFMMNNYNEFSDLLDPYLKDNLDTLITEKLKKKNITKKVESIYKRLYDKIMLVMMNDKEINKVLQRKLNKLEDA